MKPVAFLALGLSCGLCVACGSPGLDQTRADAADPAVTAIDRERLMADVRALVDVHLAETPLDCVALFDLDGVDQNRRPVCNLTRHGARAFVRQRFVELGLEVRDQAFEDERFPTLNVVAELRGVDRPDEVVIVGAHFDAFHAGADDNTSGVVAMLELARVLSQQRLSRTVRFVGFDHEEFGLVGSTRYVEHGLGRETIVGTLVFDCIGYSDSTRGSQSSLPGLPVPDTGDFLAIIANDQSAEQAAQVRALSSHFDLLPTQTVMAPRDGAFPVTGNLMRSDHAPFWLRGHTALFFTDTANFRNPNYHKPSDTLETLDPDFLTRVTQVAAASLTYFAEVAP